MPNPSSKKPFTDISSPDSSAVEALLIRGIHEFNQGEFYACHDTLEAIWMDAEIAEKPFYQGILQVAVAFYHLSHLNWRGGAILLGEGITRLRKFEPSYKGIAVADLVDQSVEWLSLVQSAGAEGLAALMEALPQPLPQVQWTPSPPPLEP
ncbi:MAG: DUF309 domain-containing protein [Phormidesmis sp. RL_2_1]|nr:DUF309 domain-containing protein [Phormidesmis sp. RL_2_1]